MRRFAEQLPSIAPNYLRYPVPDESRLGGAWDITLTFSAIPPDQLLAADGADAQRGRNQGSGEMTGVVSLFQALEKQLGLKLEKHVRSEPVFVIDHLEESPGDN